MIGDNSSGSSHACDDVQGMEVLRAGLLTQETALKALAENVDHKFQALKKRFDEIADRLDDLAIGAIGMMIYGDQEMKLLKASLLTSLYLDITVDNLSTVMTQKRRTISCMPIIGLQEVVVDVIMVMRGTL